MDEKITNQKLRDMARDALNNWLFDADTDPDGDCKRGLEYLASEGDWEQDVIDFRFNDGVFPTMDKWEILSEWACHLGHL